MEGGRTWALVVADSEVWGNTGPGVFKDAARRCNAGNVSGALPDDLGEVAPSLEVAHVGFLAVVTSVERFLSVVKHVAYDGGDVRALDTGSNVLAIATTTGSTMNH